MSFCVLHRTRSARIAAAAAGLLASACASVAAPEPPAIVETLSAGGAVQDASASQSRLFSETWWIEIGGAPLDGLVRQLQAENLDVRAAADRIVQARALARQAGALRLPQVSGELTAGGGRGPDALGDFDWTESYGASVAGSWDTDLFGGRRAAERSAALSAAAAELNAQSISQTAIAQLAQAYVDAWALTEQIRIAAALADSFDETAELTNQRYRTGSQTAGALDTLIARQNAAAARAALPELEALRRVQFQTIDLLLGREPGSGATNPSVSPAAGALPPTPESAPADLLRRRPDVAAAELAYRAGLADLEVAEAARRPSLVLSGVVSVRDEDLDDLFDADRLITDLAAGLTAPIFQGGRLKAEADRAAARARELANAYGQTALRAASDVERALALSAAYDREIDLREQSVSVARLSDQIAQERYAAGQTNLLAVLETRRALNSAERDLVGARQAALNTRIDLALAAGGGWGALSIDDQGPSS